MPHTPLKETLHRIILCQPLHHLSAKYISKIVRDFNEIEMLELHVKNQSCVRSDIMIKLQFG